MKVCVPAANDAGLSREPHGHFGSAPYFVIHDTTADTTEILSNANQVHEHGACQPVAAFSEQKIDAVIVGGIGAGAIMKLNAAGIRVYCAGSGTIADNLKALQSNALEELTPATGCRQQGGCSH